MSRVGVSRASRAVQDDVSPKRRRDCMYRVDFTREGPHWSAQDGTCASRSPLIKSAAHAVHYGLEHKFF